MYVKTGLYTGNGVASGTTNAITGLGFQPRFVMVRRYNSSEVPVARSESMAANNSKYVTSSTAISTSQGITSLDADGFTLTGNDTPTNQTAATYFYLAVGGEGADFMYGSYTGNATDNRNITIGGSFSGTPDLVIVMGENADRAVWRSSDMSGDLSGAFNQSFTTNVIQSFAAGTFQVGTNAQTNSNAVVYHYVAFKNASAVFKVFTYTGNGSDNRDITGFGFQPTSAYIQQSGVSGVIRNAAAHSGDSSTNFDNTAGNAANKIQSFVSDGVQVGTDASVNTNTTVYYGFAFKDAAPAAPTYQSYRSIQRSLNPSDWGGTATAFLEIHGKTASGGQPLLAQLYNVTDAAVVTGSTISSAATSVTRARSGSFSLASGTKVYEVRYGGSAGVAYTMEDAVVIVDVT